MIELTEMLAKTQEENEKLKDELCQARSSEQTALIELAKCEQLLQTLREMQDPDEWAPFANRHGQLICYNEVLKRDRKELRHAIEEVTAGKEQFRKRLQAMRELCGYVENGTDDSIIIGQDDATKTWHVYYASKPFKTIAWGNTFDEMLDNVTEELRRLCEEG